MKLNFDNKTLKISSNNVITGLISIVLEDNLFFPEKYWNDSIVAILDTWNQNVIDILKGGSKEAQFVFFDGPFFFKIQKEEIKYVVHFFMNSKCIRSSVINLNEFGTNLIKSSQEILEEINKRKWESFEIKQLRLSLKYGKAFFNEIL